ncbi:Transcription factor tau subunit [Fulvia fulva]|uniref:Transcription factor tau subunit n=1 Tax=Passalora fulva TaxID=5499 RepID=A0A9Q8LC78_PASFU|nr:Transcription factor tau subunit [Fulvia fulva]KAK4631649.1 Transcription factor tau subunit [Fulvia fulva]KAK4632666.1 Transcription factor tau subunit [Fulvia fulva]UJO14078.1 Transcription factor tau subunit [Fulvia fulva]WPV11919.1 Transcription factor tau subunit [Fulvia fulva]WPV25885.1 Transcription factor tau subunit [Fulvia fulva]
MVLEVIYVVRHGYRSNWHVDPSTGHYNSNVPSPTGIVADPALASYGVKQAEELGKHLETVDPTVDLIYSSPFYRCIHTLKPFVSAKAEREGKDTIKVYVEPGVGEFYGLARFDHPSPAPIEELNRHFDHLQAVKPPSIVPSTKGESIPQLHDRVAYALQHIIARADADPAGPKTLLICTHAAAMIAIGRTLTGRMPEDEGEEDFKCFTCSFSKFVRRQQPITDGTNGAKANGTQLNSDWTPESPDQVPDIGWRNGNGVSGGWHCEINGDCSFLAGGEERGWNFDIEKAQAGKVTGSEF